MKIVDDDGNELPWDGKAFGELLVRGPWIASGYFKGEGGGSARRRTAGSPPATSRPSTPTATAAHRPLQGRHQVRRRVDQLDRSGERRDRRIRRSREAAVIGMPHPKWGERPLLIVVPKPGAHGRPATR